MFLDWTGPGMAKPSCLTLTLTVPTTLLSGSFPTSFNVGTTLWNVLSSISPCNKFAVSFKICIYHHASLTQFVTCKAVHES